jgi:hypothetical protein
MEHPMGMTCSTHIKMRKAYAIFVGNPEGKKALGRLGHG